MHVIVVSWSVTHLGSFHNNPYHIRCWFSYDPSSAIANCRKYSTCSSTISFWQKLLQLLKSFGLSSYEAWNVVGNKRSNKKTYADFITIKCLQKMEWNFIHILICNFTQVSWEARYNSPLSMSLSFLLSLVTWQLLFDLV